ncbi:CotH kinase family protein [Flavobacterium sp.]|uniref:CotH kinase family protein n=1 Tax=Flavobacterium sp. TaxID=239 RepID=UPI00120E5DA7|nr:CotH kinase family protein [Flavobacterium sp.]RZJ71783.1 MAG: T9SS type A sorting domain-containing protein [Flavobacterium sp.]
MTKTLLTLLLSTLAFTAKAQIAKNPQKETTTHTMALHTVAEELVQQRTKYSRTFRNTNTTKTTVQSSVPLHYLGTDGSWHSIDYSAKKSGTSILYPAQEAFVSVDSKNGAIKFSQQNIVLQGETSFTFVTSDGRPAQTIDTKKWETSNLTGNELRFQNASQPLSKSVNFYEQALKYGYSIANQSAFSGQFDKMLVSEIVSLPRGFSLQNDSATNRISVLDANGNEILVFQQPIISDAKVLPRSQRNLSIEGRYKVTKIDETHHRIEIGIDGSWLQSPKRVFPITIDPVVTVNNLNSINSCFFPSYQQAPLSVAVPAGETVLSSNISYDFIAVAGSGAWMSDQRSFVSGPNGQTAVQIGVGDTAGTYTYNINDATIGNVVSTGQIQYTFNFARDYGGSGCNATYDFVNRRTVSVTYGAIEFGNGPLVINEYSAANRNFNDGFNRNEDWVELYNSSPTSYFNLAGYYLSNNVNNPTKWQIQDGIIPPNSRVLIFCSNRGISSGTVLHASFDLTQTDPDEIVLSDPSGTILESIVMTATQTNHSYGRTTDGAATWSVFSIPTPGQSNTNGFANYSTKPTISVPAGKYASSISVTLATTGQNEQIRYTLNGATPTATSALYAGPITISQSSVLRARTFSTSPAILPGFIETNTYLINETSTLPTVSVSGDANLLTLLNGTQIEPTGYFEYFESDGTFVDETMGDFDKHGNDSWAYNQRGIDFIARDDHGYKRRLEHQFFNTSDRTNYRRLILKAAGSDNFPFQSGGAHMRDVFVQKISETAGLDLDERRSSFVSLFVNGQYWGVYDLREKVDDNQYTDYYYGQDYIFRDSDQYIQYIKTWGATNPEFGNQPAIAAWDNLMTFVQSNDMAVEANYDYVDSQLNINSLIDYFVLNSYMVNKDWLNWNTSWWRGLNPSGGALKWRYSLWDCDGVLGHYINYTGIPDITADADPCNAEALDVGVGHAQTIEKLITESPIVRQRYITRYADLLNTHLSCEQVTQVFDSIVSVLTPEMPKQIQRWGGNMATWQANVQEARTFLLARCSQTINTGMVECYNVTGPFETVFEVQPANSGTIKMNSEWLAQYPYTANIFGNIETLLKAQANTGYEFSHWTVDGTTISPNDTSIDIVLEISQATSVTAHFVEQTNAEQALYYWHFNNLVTPVDVTTIPADYNQVSGANPMMTYTGSGPRDIDANNTGSILNTHFDELSGKCARVRNPSQGRTIQFDLPTTGFEQIKFAYAIQRTNEGQLMNHISYSLDGTTFLQTGLTQSTFNIGTDFSLVNLDLSAINAANNNANFKIRIAFEGNTTGDNGNNRFDNVTLKGTQQLSVPQADAAVFSLYPNPFTDKVHVVGNQPINEMYVYDVLGKNIWKKTNVGTNNQTIELGELSAGIYFLKVKFEKGSKTFKLIRQ